MRKNLLLPTFLATALAAHPGAAQSTSTTCATSTVCAEYINSYSGSTGGVAIHGEANSGIGVRGTSVSNTGFYGASGSGSYIAPGVEGESTNHSGLDAGGFFGLAGLLPGGTSPAYGAIGLGSLYGLEGATTSTGSSSTRGYGVFAYDNSNAGTFNAAALAESQNGVGIVAESHGSPSLGLIGDFPIGVYAVAEPNGSGTPNSAVAIEAESTSYPLEVRNTTASANAFVDVAQPGYLVAGTGSGGSFYITTAGKEHLSGTLVTSKGTSIRKTGQSGTTRMQYGAQTTAPQIEDVGEAALTNGRAFVAVDAALADSIDMHRAYHVFLTPEGECNGLYVTQKSPGGFVVRELHGGRSNLSFEYRIVAKPVGETGERLALAGALPEARPSGVLSAKHLPATLSLEDALKQKLGPAGYARALADLKKRIEAR
jgi:hypothetical protein